ncbi:MAG TPA: hypothetical protein VGQ59_10470 [Cyclobacteriaceae bacterium]|jgi:hypothetical protein|nr:hypothetical protein [Cyclobacteriaceae bacterium]
MSYIAKLVDKYKTNNGNFFCREENKSLEEQPINWPIFVSSEYSDKMVTLPIYGIIITDYNKSFFNGQSRPTCRVLSHDKSELEKILAEEAELNKPLQ